MYATFFFKLHEVRSHCAGAFLFLLFTVIPYDCSTEFSLASELLNVSSAGWPGPRLCLVFLVNLHPLRVDVCPWGERVQAPWEVRDRPPALSEMNKGGTSFRPQRPPVKNRKSNLRRPLDVGRDPPAVPPPWSVREKQSWKKTPCSSVGDWEWWQGLTSSRASELTVPTPFKIYLIVCFLGFCGYRWLSSWKQRVEQKPFPFLCNTQLSLDNTDFPKQAEFRRAQSNNFSWGQVAVGRRSHDNCMPQTLGSLPVFRPLFHFYQILTIH